MRRKLLIWLLTACAGWTCASAARAGSVALDYATSRKVIRACIALPPGIASASPYVFYLLDRSEVPVTVAASGRSFVFYPPKPGGWEFENPLAPPGLPKSNAAYWTVALTSLDLPRLRNFDLVLLPVKEGGIDLSSLSMSQQWSIPQVLTAWVDEGGLLWVDRQRDQVNVAEGHASLFVEPTLRFPATSAAPATKWATDPGHPLLRGRFDLGPDGVDLLGRQQTYALGPSGASTLDTIFRRWPDSPSGAAIALQADPKPTVTEVVATQSSGITPQPVVAAGRLGQGAVLVTACGVGEGIQDWYQGMLVGTAPANLELPEWSLPDFKLIYNAIQWTMDWPDQQGGPRHQGRFAGALPGPLSLVWSQMRQSAISGAPVVERGVAYLGWADGALGLYDVTPREGRAGGRADDGIPDWSVGAAADEIGRLTLSGATLVGSPALASVYDPTALELGPALTGSGVAPGPRPIAVVVARNATGDQSLLFALPADPDLYRSAVPVPVTSANAYWWASLNDGVSVNYGVSACGPVAVDNMILVATSDTGPSPQAGTASTAQGHLLLFDAAAPNAAPLNREAKPVAAVNLSAGGYPLRITSPPAVGYTRVWDAVTNSISAAQVVVFTGNNVYAQAPTAAAGYRCIFPMAVRVTTPGLTNRQLTEASGNVWLADDTLDANGDGIPDDTFANQRVKVYAYNNLTSAYDLPLPPHQNDDPAAPLNYARQLTANGSAIQIVFTRFSLFRRYPAGNAKYLTVVLPDSSSRQVEFSIVQPPVALFARAPENGQSSPAVAGETAFVVGEAINGYPNSSTLGNVTAVGLGMERIAGPLWTFSGDVTGGPSRYNASDPSDYYTSFTFSPAYANGVVYAAGNYQFSQRRGTTEVTPMPNGPAGVLYALNANASPNLLSVAPNDPKVYDPTTAVVSGEPTLSAGLPDLQAPVGQSANPNEVAQPGRRGVAVWITDRINPADPQYNAQPDQALSQRSGQTVNWMVDFANGIIRLGPGAFGRYQNRPLRVRYFVGGVIPNGGDGVIMQADRLVNWEYDLASFDSGNNELAAAQVISPPVAADGVVHVMVRSNLAETTGVTLPSGATPVYRRYLVTLRETPADLAAPDHLLNPWGAPTAYWQPIGGAEPNDPMVAAPAAAGDRLIVATNVGSAGRVEGFANAATLIADNERVVEAQGAGQIAWAGLGSREPSPGVGTSPSNPNSGTLDAAIPAHDTYADSAYRGFSRPSWARHLEGGRALVCDTGHDRVAEIEPNGDLVWEYPGVQIAQGLYRAGTATTTTGSPVVAGDASTQWTSIAAAGDRFRLDADSTWYTVQSVDSDLQLTLTTPFAGAGATGAYTLLHTQRDATPEAERLLGPLDAHRYRQRQAPIASSTLSDPISEMNWSYTAGTATATTASPTITGTSTTWTASVRPGDWFKLDADPNWQVIASVDSDTQITLALPYTDAGGSGAYTIATPVTVEWQATLIADTGHNRVLEVMQPLLNGRYRPWVYSVLSQRATADGYGQAAVVTGSDQVTRSGGSVDWMNNLRSGDYLQVGGSGPWCAVASVSPTDNSLRLTRPYAGGSGTADFIVQRRLTYRQYGQEVVGARTVWNAASPTALNVTLSPGYAERLGDPAAGANTVRLICAVTNNPRDPSGRDRFVSVVDVLVQYQNPADAQYAYPRLGADPRRVASSVIQMHADPQTGSPGINLFAPRTGVARDFLRVRQAEPIPRGTDDYNTLIVDDAGVKEINDNTWSSAGAGLVFEFTASNKWLPTTPTYLEEMLALSTQLATYAPPASYPSLIQEPAALRDAAYQNVSAYADATVQLQPPPAGTGSGQVDFLPVAAWKNRALAAYYAPDGGTYTIVNAYADPYQAAGGEPIGAPAKSEVFELDPRLDLLQAYRPGRRIVRWDFDSAKAGLSTSSGDQGAPLYGFGSWPHFIVPDPSLSLYPWMPGTSYGLKQPQGVDRY